MNGDGEQSVLRLRLATLRRNLEQVKGTAAMVAHRREEVDALVELFDDQDGVQWTGRALQTNIATCRETIEVIARIDGVSSKMVELLRSRLNECTTHATNILELAGHSANIVESMKHRWATLSPDEKFDEHIRDIFAVQATALIKKIDDIAASEPDVAWRCFQKEIRAESEDLFSEYVEFLGGLALRDTGFGEPAAAVPVNGSEPAEQLGADVYVMADDLIRQIYRIGRGDLWHSLTIPARRDASARTLARMIRLGFPEWTVWAVPLAPYEFGRVVVSEENVVKLYATRFGGVELGLEIIMADVFGTYTIGPAYAFAAIYVLLDPRAREHEPPAADDDQERPTRAESQVRSDSDRAHVVLSTLAAMDSGGELTTVINDLRARWEMAVEQANGVALPTGAATERLDKPAEFLLTFLRDNAPAVEYKSSRWDEVRAWSNLAQLERDNWLPPAGGEGVRDILNAAWLQRMTAGPNPEVDAKLAEAALALWRRDLRSRRLHGTTARRGGLG